MHHRYLQETPENQQTLKLVEHLEPQPVSKTIEITQKTCQFIWAGQGHNITLNKTKTTVETHKTTGQLYTIICLNTSCCVLVLTC